LVDPLIGAGRFQVGFDPLIRLEEFKADIGFDPSRRDIILDRSGISTRQLRGHQAETFGDLDQEGGGYGGFEGCHAAGITGSDQSIEFQ
jgi:hypothetical protein